MRQHAAGRRQQETLTWQQYLHENGWVNQS